MENNKRGRIILLDNLDSFTYNLVDEFYKLDFEVHVYRNTLKAAFIKSRMDEAKGAVYLVLSPGPGQPERAGCMPELIELCAGEYPIAGICLGHQALVQYLGGTIIPAETIMHGKSSLIKHCGERMFRDLPQPMAVGRYHSLAAGHIPPGLEVLAHFENIPMAVWHEELHLFGVQFHPESLLTTHGARLLNQTFRFMEEKHYANASR